MRRLYGMLVFALIAAALSACGGATPTAPASSGESKPLRKVTLAMSYIPNVQFAPYYLAQSKGYYAAEGLEVAFDYNFENDVVTRTAQGTADFAMASGLSVLLARGQDLPVATVMTLYQQFPVVFFAKSSQNIKTVADMRGKSVGLPGRFGASYYGLLAMLYANKIAESELNIQEIGFTQAQALLEDKVQVATGYAMNEPVALREQGQQLDVIRVADSFALASDGVVASQKLIESEPEVVRGFVRATLKGLSDTLANPDEAFDISLKQIPEIKDDAQRTFQRTQLQETLAYWQSDATEAQGLGYTDPDVMQKTHTFLRESALLKRDVEVGKAFTNEYLK